MKYSETNPPIMGNRIAKMNTRYDIKSGGSTILIIALFLYFRLKQTVIANLIFFILAFGSISKPEKELIARQNMNNY